MLYSPEARTFFYSISKGGSESIKLGEWGCFEHNSIFMRNWANFLYSNSTAKFGPFYQPSLYACEIGLFCRILLGHGKLDYFAILGRTMQNWGVSHTKSIFMRNQAVLPHFIPTCKTKLFSHMSCEHAKLSCFTSQVLHIHAKFGCFTTLESKLQNWLVLPHFNSTSEIGQIYHTLYRHAKLACFTTLQLDMRN